MTSTDEPATELTVDVTVDGRSFSTTVDPRTTLLDLLRERFDVVAPKKGCDHGQCGSCTVLLDGRRHLTCLALAVAHDGADIVTAEGLAGGSGGGEQDLHPVQRAFLEHDAYQCGYCTPGQICSAIGMMRELAAGHPSHVSPDLTAAPEASDDEIRERMSGNLCRCGAYVGILAALRDSIEASA